MKSILSLLIVFLANLPAAAQYTPKEPMIIMEPSVYQNLVDWKSKNPLKYVKIGIISGTGSDISGKSIMLNGTFVSFGGDDVIHNDEIPIKIGKVNTYINKRDLKKLDGHIIRELFISSINHDYSTHIYTLERAPALDLVVAPLQNDKSTPPNF